VRVAGNRRWTLSGLATTARTEVRAGRAPRPTGERNSSGRFWVFGPVLDCKQALLNMKTIFCVLAVVLGVAQHVHAQGAAGVIAKQRAREVVNQSNVRQGVGAPEAPTTPTAAQPARPQAADPLSKLKADLATITGSSAVSAELKKQLATNMLACSRGSKKPTRAAVEKFAESVSAALAGKSLEASVTSRLAQDLNLALNSASLSAQRTTEISDDVQAILQTGGVARASAVTVTGELKAIVTELQAK